MIARLRRVFARAPNAAPRAPAADVAIIDATETGLGTWLRDDLLRRDLPARLAAPPDLLAAAPATVLLFPATARILPDPAAQLLAIVDALASNNRARPPFHGRIVLAWCVRHGDRARLAAPVPLVRNWSPLLLGTSWPAELAHHAASEPAAASCVSGQLATLMRAHRTLAGIPVATLLGALHTLDPRLLQALAITASGADPPDPWLDLSPVAAAIRSRLGMPRSRPDHGIRGGPGTATATAASSSRHPVDSAEN